MMRDSGARTWDVVVIGAGASGLFCAAACGRRGRAVLVLDHAERTGTKVRISGGGHCNFTNRNATAAHYLSANPHFCKSALARFTPSDLLALVERHGIPHREKEAGQLFCAGSAREVVSLLERECAAAGVRIRLGCRVLDLERRRDFVLDTSAGIFHAASLIIATGGLSYAKLGATGFGHEVARRFGLAVVEPRPALVPFVLAGEDRIFCRELAGVSLGAEVSCGGKSFRDSLLFTHRGVSGPAALQASLYWRPGSPLAVDLLPGTDLFGELAARRESKAELRTLLAGYLPKRLARGWCERRKITGSVNRTAERDLRRLADELRRWEIIPGGTEGYATAEVTAGGVDTGELSSKTMEAKKAPGLYFIGEVVDVTGELGGFNLHWAWASAFAAGQHA